MCSLRTVGPAVKQASSRKISRYARCTSTTAEPTATTPNILSHEAYASLDRIPPARCSCFDRPTTHGYGRGAGWGRTPMIRLLFCMLHCSDRKSNLSGHSTFSQTPLPIPPSFTPGSPSSRINVTLVPPSRRSHT
jgi:hypothetical protein